MFSVSFKSNNTNQYANMYPKRNGLSPNAQNVLNKTNKAACGVNAINSYTAPNQNVSDVVKNTAMYLAMSSPLVNALYTSSQIQKENLSKDEAKKIFMYNMMCH